MPKGISEKLHEQRRQIAQTVKKLDGDRLEAARQWGCSQDYVNKVCREFNICPNKRITIASIVKIVAELLQTDKKLIDIAAECGNKMAVWEVAKQAKKNGLKFTHRPVGRPRKHF